MVKFRNVESGSKCLTRKCNIVNDQSNANYDAGNKVIYNTEILKSNLFYYSDAYILVKGDFTTVVDNGTQVEFKNCAPFTKCNTKLDGTKITARKTMFSFSKCSEKIVFARKLHWNMTFLVLSRETVFLFSKNVILFLRRKMNDDLFQKIHGNMILSVYSAKILRYSFLIRYIFSKRYSFLILSRKQR